MRTEEEIKVLIQKFNNDVAKRSRGMRLLLCIDQFFAVLLWNSSQDETISSHVGRRVTDNKANWFDKLVYNTLNSIDNKHCARSLGE